MPAKCSKQRGALDYGIRHRERGQVRVERPHDDTRLQCNLPLMGGAVSFKEQVVQLRGGDHALLDLQLGRFPEKHCCSV